MGACEKHPHERGVAPCGRCGAAGAVTAWSTPVAQEAADVHVLRDVRRRDPHLGGPPCPPEARAEALLKASKAEAKVGAMAGSDHPTDEVTCPLRPSRWHHRSPPRWPPTGRRPGGKTEPTLAD